MPRKRKPIIVDVNLLRAENYAYHFQIRQMARVHPDREQISLLVSHLPRPSLTVFGAGGFSGRNCISYSTHSQEMQGYYSLCVDYFKFKFDVDQLFWWYWSDAGWTEFDRLWQDLPEVINIQVGTNGKVVHICTQDTFSYPSQKV